MGDFRFYPPSDLTKIYGDFMTTEEIIGQALSLVAVALFATSYQIKKNRSIIIVQTAGTVCFCLSYLLIGATAGFAINIVCILRNILYIFIPPKTTLLYVATAALVAAMGVVGSLSWEGPVSLLIILPLMVNTVFLSLENPTLLRKSVVFTSSGILVYNIFVASGGGIISESISISSSIVAIIRYRKSSSSKTIAISEVK